MEVFAILSESGSPRGVGGGSEVPQLSSKASEFIAIQSRKHSRAINLCLVGKNMSNREDRTGQFFCVKNPQITTH